MSLQDDLNLKNFSKNNDDSSIQSPSDRLAQDQIGELQHQIGELQHQMNKLEHQMRVSKQEKDAYADALFGILNIMHAHFDDLHSTIHNNPQMQSYVRNSFNNCANIISSLDQALSAIKRDQIQPTSSTAESPSQASRREILSGDLFH